MPDYGVDEPATTSRSPSVVNEPRLLKFQPNADDPEVVFSSITPVVPVLGTAAVDQPVVRVKLDLFSQVSVGESALALSAVPARSETQLTPKNRLRAACVPRKWE